MRQCVKAALRHYNTMLLRQCGVSEVPRCGIAALPYSIIAELRSCGDVAAMKCDVVDEADALSRTP